MFDIGFFEILIIAVIALFVIGPKELPSFLRTVARYVKQIRSQISDIQREVTKAIDTEEIRSIRDDVNSITSFDPVKDLKEDISQAVEMPKQNSEAQPEIDKSKTEVRKFVPKTTETNRFSQTENKSETES